MKRADGRKLKKADPMYTVAAHIMSKRSDSMNSIKIYAPYDSITQYKRDKKKEGFVVSTLGIVLAAYVRTLSEYPQLNRFVVNKRLFARNSIDIGMVVLQPGKEDGETIAKMHFDRSETIYDIQHKIDEYIESNREVEADNETEKMIRFLLSIPGLLRFGVNTLKWMDRHNLLPGKVIEMSPFHATMTITNLASIRTNYIYHHVYDFGTTSMLLSMGNCEEVPVRKKGEIVFEKKIPMGLVMDERIAHGAYFAVAFKRFEQYLENPTLLEVPPEKIVEDCE